MRITVSWLLAGGALVVRQKSRADAHPDYHHGLVFGGGYGGAVVVAETCADRHLQDNAIKTLVNGSFHGLTNLFHLYGTRPVPAAPRAWRVAQREIRSDFIGRAHTVAT
jgi:hypothetical protein